MPTPLRRTSPVRVAVHGLWIGPLAATLVVSALFLAVAAADTDPDFSGVGGALVLVGYVAVLGLPVWLLCGGAAGVAAGAAAWLLRGSRVPLAVRALVGGLAATVVVGTVLVLGWDVFQTALLRLLALATCLVTGGAAVLVAGRRAGEAGPGPGPVRRRPGPGPVRRRPATPGLAAATLTVVLGGWVAALAVGAISHPVHDTAPRTGLEGGRRAPALDGRAGAWNRPGADAAAPPSATPAPTPTPPTSLAAARADVETLRAQALAAGGAGLLWQQPLSVTEAACPGGTVLELDGRFTTRDLATASDDVDFLHITQANEQVAALIAAAWTGGHPERADVMKGEYWLRPEGTPAVEQAHVGFDQGVGEVRVTSLCATAP